MKKLLFIFLVVALSFSLFSCKSKKEEKIINNLFTDNLIRVIKLANKDVYAFKTYYYFYNKEGKKVAGPYKSASYFYKGYAICDGTLINNKGELVGDKDERFRRLSDEYCLRGKDNKYAIASFDGTPLTEYKYTNVYYDESLEYFSCTIDNYTSEVLDKKFNTIYYGDFIERMTENCFIHLKYLESTDSLYVEIIDLKGKKTILNLEGIRTCNICKIKDNLFGLSGIYKSDGTLVQDGYFVDGDGKEVKIKGIKSFTAYLFDNLVVKNDKDKYNLYNKKLKKIISEDFDSLTGYNGFYLGKKDDLNYFYDKDAKKLVGGYRYFRGLAFDSSKFYYVFSNDEKEYLYYDGDFNYLFKSDILLNIERDIIFYDYLKEEYYIYYINKENKYFGKVKNKKIESKEVDYLVLGVTSGLAVCLNKNASGKTTDKYVMDIKTGDIIYKCEDLKYDISCYSDGYFLFRYQDEYKVYDTKLELVCEFVVE